MLSGGFGVAITLVLTGLWNWRDQKRTRHAIELQEIFDYIHNTNDIVRGLVVEVEFETKEQAGDVKDRAGMHAIVRALHLAEESYVRLASLVSDEDVIKIANKNLKKLHEFSLLVQALDSEQLPEEEAIGILNKELTSVTRSYAAGNRRISKRVVELNGPGWA